MASTS